MSGSVLIAPSLLASDFGSLATAAREADEAGAEFLHFDVMDGQFVPNITIGPQALRALRPASRAFFDAHLMIASPERFVEDFARAGADGITVHAEVCAHLQRTLAQIREAGARPAVALNPATPPDVLEYVLDDIDMVLVMTVNPGFGGQEFLHQVVPKIVRIRDMLATARHPIRIEVDGGITPETASIVTAAGANILVAGTAVFRSPFGVRAAVRALREAAEPGA